MTPLRQRMMEDLQLRGLSTKTQDSYLRAVRQLAEHSPLQRTIPGLSGKLPSRLTLGIGLVVLVIIGITVALIFFKQASTAQIGVTSTSPTTPTIASTPIATPLPSPTPTEKPVLPLTPIASASPTSTSEVEISFRNPNGYVVYLTIMQDGKVLLTISVLPGQYQVVKLPPENYTYRVTARFPAPTQPPTPCYTVGEGYWSYEEKISAITNQEIVIQARRFTLRTVCP